MVINTIKRRPFTDSSPDHGDELRSKQPSVQDPFCILVWKFSVEQRNTEAFTKLCAESAQRLAEQPKCLFQRLSRDGDSFRIHVGLQDSYGVLAHVVSFSRTLKQICNSARYVGIEIHGPHLELAHLQAPLEPFAPLYVAQDGNVLV